MNQSTPITWLEKASELLAANRVTLNERRYTALSPDTADFGRKDYGNQFLWDSCFTALVWRRIDPAMAQDELLSLIGGQVQDGPDAGMIPHCLYWRGGGSWLWKHDHRSAISQPPLIAVAANAVFEITQDRVFLQSIYETVSRFHEWFDRRRDPDHDHLVSLIHPWESGGDALPRWDRAMRLSDFTHERGRQARHTLAADIARFDADAAKLAESGRFHVEPMDYNAIRAADLEALAAMARTLGKPDEGAGWLRRVEAIHAAFQAKMIVDGLPYDLEGLNETPILQESAGQFVTLFGGLPTAAQAERLVGQLQEPRFWTPFPVCTSPTTADSFAPDIYWRGNVWPSINWLIAKGLRRYGYHALADELGRRGIALLETSSFYEYYHPLTGAGLGAPSYAWATALVDIALDS